MFTKLQRSVSVGDFIKFSNEKYPVASQDEMVEVYQTVTHVSIPRYNINDIAFTVPISEVDSGRFHLSRTQKHLCDEVLQ